MKLSTIIALILVPSWIYASPSPKERLKPIWTTGNEELFVEIDYLLHQYGLTEAKEKGLDFRFSHLSYPEIETWKYYAKTIDPSIDLIPSFNSDKENEWLIGYNFLHNRRHAMFEKIMIGFDSERIPILLYFKIIKHPRFPRITTDVPEKYKSIINEVKAICTDYTKQLDPIKQTPESQ